MSLFLPANVSPLPSAASYADHSDYRTAEYFTVPKDISHRQVEVEYSHLPDSLRSDAKAYVRTLLTTSPKPKGRYAFSNIHIIGPSSSQNEEGMDTEEAECTIRTIVTGAQACNVPCTLHRLSSDVCHISSRSNVSRGELAMQEYNAIFEAASSMLLHKADRASLLVYVGFSTDDVTLDAYAAFIGMLPFRGVSTALISRVRPGIRSHKNTNSFVQMQTKSGAFVYDGTNAARMGKYPIGIIYTPYEEEKEYVGTKRCAVLPWKPVDTTALLENQDDEEYDNEAKNNNEIVSIPFKIGGLQLPMITHNGSYHTAITSLATLLQARYPKGYTPVISCGETVDALGYGHDLLEALTDGDDDDANQQGMLFVHKSGESYKRYDNYGTPALFDKILMNQQGTSSKPVVIIALGGGVNGNCIGLIAAMTNVDFIEIPTTPMHYNDAVTSAKKAFSLVKVEQNSDGSSTSTILSKNILGAFYLPQLAYCINETLLTISTANAYATVGESCKTMNMLGMADSIVGMKDFSNILGAQEFASDFTRILNTVEGFEYLISFIQNHEQLKGQIIQLGTQIRTLREQLAVTAMKSTEEDLKKGTTGIPLRHHRFSSSLPSLAASDESSESEEDSDTDNDTPTMDQLLQKRRVLLHKYRAAFHTLPSTHRQGILHFLTTINREIVSAKAMFLAYSDPFEKYRALLFEYAHTLGHGVEAFANDLYNLAHTKQVQIPSEALRLHGQCVGMAVLWAGDMSRALGALEGKGYTLHQSFPYVFNRAAGGFNFAPLRALCDQLNVSKEEFTEKVLAVVRRDNKRGYCNCSDPTKSVDQLVTCRPGKMLASEDPNAEVRYLVEVDEEWQRSVLEKAFELEFDQVCDVRDNELVFVSSSTGITQTSSADVAKCIRSQLLDMYKSDLPSSTGAN